MTSSLLIIMLFVYWAILILIALPTGDIVSFTWLSYSLQLICFSIMVCLWRFLSTLGTPSVAFEIWAHLACLTGSLVALLFWNYIHAHKFYIEGKPINSLKQLTYGYIPYVISVALIEGVLIG